MNRILLPVLLAAATAAAAADAGRVDMRKLHLTPEFWSEGAAVGDFNHDGKPDVTAGPFWWTGPDFTARHAYRAADKTSTVKKPDGSEETIAGYKGSLGNENDYSDNFYSYARDMNGDGWDDILVVGLPSTKLRVHINPKGGDAPWAVHEVFGPVDNETPMFTDLVGDDGPELVCNADGYFVYVQPGDDATQPWTAHRITPKGAWHKYTHGLGVGDVNGDGRADVIEQNGWWEQPAELAGDPEWVFHAVPFAPGPGSAQMFAYDVNGDGLNDVLTCLAPHGYGLAWYEQKRVGDAVTFERHLIMGDKPEDSPYGVKFSQPHAMELVDFDGDGLKDLLVGKRFWAHGPKGDVEPDAPAVVYWFRLVRGPKGAEFVPSLLDDNSGVGMQVVPADLDGDGRLDVALSNKRGVHLLFRGTP